MVDRRLAKFVHHVKSFSTIQETCPLVCTVGVALVGLVTVEKVVWSVADDEL